MKNVGSASWFQPYTAENYLIFPYTEKQVCEGEAGGCAHPGGRFDVRQVARRAGEREGESTAREGTARGREARERDRGATQACADAEGALRRRSEDDPVCVLQGRTCEKGNKCKFSHDVNVGRKVEKKNLYADSREEKEKGACTARGAQ